MSGWMDSEWVNEWINERMNDEWTKSSKTIVLKKKKKNQEV